MIGSGIHSKSSINFLTEEIKYEEPSQEEVTVQKSTMYHLIHAYLLSIFNNSSYDEQQKINICGEYAEELGYNLAEEQCLGFVKYCVGKSEKNENKLFVGEMKLLNSRIWSIIAGKKASLFAVSTDTPLINSYKIEDKEFKLGSSICGEGEKEYRKMLIQFCRKIVIGVLNRFQITGDIMCCESADGGVYVEIKNLVKRENESNKLEKMKSNIF